MLAKQHSVAVRGVSSEIQVLLALNASDLWAHCSPFLCFLICKMGWCLPHMTVMKRMDTSVFNIFLLLLLNYISPGMSWALLLAVQFLAQAFEIFIRCWQITLERGHPNFYNHCPALLSNR